MRFVRFHLPQEGPRLGVIVEKDKVIDYTGMTHGRTLSFQDLLAESKKTNLSVGQIVKEEIGRGLPEITYHYHELAIAPLHSEQPHLLLPIVPAEVWAAGVTYKRSVEARIAESQVSNVYDKVYDAVRPEIFFKATSTRVVGTGDTIGLRRDSHSTVPEPELGVVLGANLEIVGFIIGNDLTSRDIEGENPLYLPQAKIFNHSCALGPILALTDAIPDPYTLNISCEIYRNNGLVFSEKANTDQLKRKLEELVDFLGRDNHIYPGTVLLTGTCIVPPDTFTLMAGDLVNISIDLLGVLSNRVA